MRAYNALLAGIGLAMCLAMAGCVTQRETVTVLDPSEPVLEVNEQE